MSPARIIVLVVALVAGLGAAMLMQRPTAEAPAPATRVEAVATTGVLVAAADIPVGNTVAAGDIRWIDWPKVSVPPGVIRQDETPEGDKELIGQIARYGILNAEPMRREKLIKTDGTGFLSAVLPSGSRAVAISTDSRGANTAGGFILPNDRVDVICTYKNEASDGRGGDGFFSTAILRNVRVLAIGQNVQERNGEKVVVGETATLEVDPVQVEVLTQAQKAGSLSLALRSLKDTGEAAPPASQESAMTIVRYGVTTKSVKQ